MTEELHRDSCLLSPQHGFEVDSLPLSDEDVDFGITKSKKEIEVEEGIVVANRVSRPHIDGYYQAKAATRQNRSNSDIDSIIIHTPEGYEAGTLSVLNQGRAGFDWFLPPSGNLYKTNAFSKYVAWQAGHWPYNLRSIGVEQWDFASNMGNAPDAHYRRLAHLIAWLTQLLNIPVRRAAYGESGLIAHAQVTPQSRTDPGKSFDWDKLVRFTKEVRGLNTSPAPSPQKPQVPDNNRPVEKTDLERINFLSHGKKDLMVSSAAAQALNRIAKQRDMNDKFARRVTHAPRIRYAANQAWSFKGDYLISVICGGPAARQIDDDKVQAVEKDPSSGNLLGAIGSSYHDTKVQTSWRLLHVCNELGLGQTEKDQVLNYYKMKVGLK